MNDEIRWICGNKIDISLIKEIEQIYDIKFPSSYIDIVLKNDGASALPHSIYCGNGRSEDFQMFIPLGFYEGLTPLKEVLENLNFPDKIIPFADDSGGNSFCFDFRSSENPEVVFHEHEMGEEDVKGNFWRVAKSFDEFIDNIGEPL